MLALVVAWHRRGFALYWRWRSRPRRPGRPSIARQTRHLIRRMQRANPLWGAPRIHAELAKLGIEVSQATVANYLRRPRRPPSQTWRTFLTTHAAQLASTDFFTVPTATFRVLFVLVILSHDRRRVVHVVVDRHGNGLVDNLGEFFGQAVSGSRRSAVALRALAWRRRNGPATSLADLALFDRPEQGGNGDGEISAADAVFGRL